MNIKYLLVYILVFVALFSVIDQLHEWLHYFMAAAYCGCFGSKILSGWTFCSNSELPSAAKAAVWLTGPLLNYVLMWIGWWLMGKSGRTWKQKSLGLALVFASLPFARLIAALQGGGDETLALRMLFQHADGGNKHLISVAGLLLVFILSVAPVVRAFFLFRSWKERLSCFLLFFLVPPLIDQWLTSEQMYRWLNQGFLKNPVFPGVDILVLAWIAGWFLLVLIWQKKLLGFLDWLWSNP
jgi:hypothetical protein